MTYRCIKPTCDSLGCVGCNCAIPEEIYLAIVAEEREACAKVCESEKVGANKDDQEADRYYDRALTDAAKSIRNRNNKG